MTKGTSVDSEEFKNGSSLVSSKTGTLAAELTLQRLTHAAPNCRRNVMVRPKIHRSCGLFGGTLFFTKGVKINDLQCLLSSRLQMNASRDIHPQYENGPRAVYSVGTADPVWLSAHSVGTADPVWLSAHSVGTADPVWLSAHSVGTADPV